jgi:hypothetical protein
MRGRSRHRSASTYAVKRLFSHWHLDNIKVVRRVIVSVVGITVLLIGIALLVLPGPAFVLIPVGSRFSPRSMHGRADGSEKFVKLRATLSPVASERQIAILSHRAIVAKTRNPQPSAPNTRLTMQNERFFVSAEIAAMAIAIWNIVTLRAKTSCL